MPSIAKTLLIACFGAARRGRAARPGRRPGNNPVAAGRGPAGRQKRAADRQLRRPAAADGDHAEERSHQPAAGPLQGNRPGGRCRRPQARPAPRRPRQGHRPHLGEEFHRGRAEGHQRLLLQRRRQEVQGAWPPIGRSRRHQGEPELARSRARRAAGHGDGGPEDRWVTSSERSGAPLRLRSVRHRRRFGGRARGAPGRRARQAGGGRRGGPRRRHLRAARLRAEEAVRPCLPLRRAVRGCRRLRLARGRAPLRLADAGPQRIGRRLVAERHLHPQP